MTALDDLPSVNSVLSLDLKTASLIIAAIGVVSAYNLLTNNIYPTGHKNKVVIIFYFRPFYL